MKMILPDCNIGTKCTKLQLTTSMCKVYTRFVDVIFTYRGQVFVWNGLKALENVRKHGVRFETAAEVFFDPSNFDEDASVDEEARLAVIGRTENYQALYVVHVQRDEVGTRIISAREATKKEIRIYENGS